MIRILLMIMRRIREVKEGRMQENPLLNHQRKIKKSGSTKAAKERKSSWFDMLLKSNIDQDEDCILGISTLTMAKKIKKLIKKDELTITDQEGVGLEMLKRQYKNYVELEYHVDQLKASMTEEAQYYNEGIEDLISDRCSKEVHLYHVDALNEGGIQFSNVNQGQENRQQRLDYKIDFINALLLYIRRVVVKNRIEDIQLGVKSYQHTLNLTKPKLYFLGIDHKIPYTTTGTEKGVVYLNKYIMKSIMQRNEVHKFCDGTLLKVQDNLLKKSKENKLGRGNMKL
ncbi:hypothetical protein Tco_0718475 [Tanacetum coccineum]